MKTLRVNVSEEDEQALMRRAQDAGFQDVGDYLAGIVKSHLETQDSFDSFMPAKELEAALLQGIESGNPVVWNEEFSQGVREEIRKRLAIHGNSQSSS